MTAKKPKGETADETKTEPTTVRVRYLRTHYPAGQINPKTIGLEEELPTDEARGLATYGILEVLADREAPEGEAATLRMPSKAAIARIQQLMPAADLGEEAAITELEKIRDQELAGGKARDSVLAQLRSAKVNGLPDSTE